jgi:RimJ/RimL family protein N-acetyltransferase
LIDWVLQQPGVRGVVARSDADNLGSAGVLEGAGFSRTDEADGQLTWILLRRSAREPGDRR